MSFLGSKVQSNTELNKAATKPEKTTAKQGEPDYAEEEEDSGYLIRHGYMMKKGNRRKTWKFRYFKLYDNLVLKYYQDDGYSLVCGQTSLETGRVIEKKDSGEEGWPFEFHIKTSNRTWEFRCRKEDEREKWIHSMKIRWKKGGKYKYSTMTHRPMNKFYSSDEG
eukprot:UN29108